MGESSFDSDLYSKNLDKVLGIAMEEYKQVTFDRYREQNVLIRNYMWIGVAILGAEVAVFSQVGKATSWLLKGASLNPCFATCAIFALMLAVFAIAMGVHTMHSKGGISMPLYGMQPLLFASIAWKEANKDVSETTMVIKLLEQLEKATSHNLDLAITKGTRLKWMSRCLLASVALAVCATGSAFF